MAKKTGDVLLEVHDPAPVVLQTTGSPDVEAHAPYRDERITVADDCLVVVALHVTVHAFDAQNWPGTLYLQVDGEFTGDAARSNRSDVDPVLLNGLFPLWLTGGEHTLGFVFGAVGGATSTLTDWTLVVRAA